MQEIGIAETREHVLALNAHLLDGLDELKAKVVDAAAPEAPRRAHLREVEGRRSARLRARREGIVTSERDDNLRISAHCYNSVEDVDAVLASLQRHRDLLA